MSIEIPTGLTDLLQDFTVAVLRERPDDLVEFAASHFGKLHEIESGNKGKREVKFSEPADVDSDVDDEPPELPRNRFSRRKSVCAERYDPEADDETENDAKVVFPKSDEQRARLAASVKNILLFRALEKEQMQQVLDAMFEKRTQPGDHIIDQDDDGDNFYVIDSGLYDIFVGGNKVGAYNNTGSFGELALMYNTPRAATIVATSPGSLWALDRSSFRRIVLKNAAKKRKMYETLLENVSMLKSLEPYERMNLADALLTKKYCDGECIIAQGDEADGCYFIEDGSVRITMKNKNADDPTKEKQIATFNKGQFFGELALITNNPRAASVYACGDVRCAFLDVNAFERLLGPCMDIMKRNIAHYEEEVDRMFGKGGAK